MIKYPENLPCPNREGFSGAVSENQLRTVFDTGNDRARARYQQQSHTFNYSFSMAEFEFWKWWRDEALNTGVEWFSTKYYMAKNKLATCESRYISDYTFNPISQDDVQVNVKIDIRNIDAKTVNDPAAYAPQGLSIASYNSFIGFDGSSGGVILVAPSYVSNIDPKPDGFKLNVVSAGSGQVTLSHELSNHGVLPAGALSLTSQTDLVLNPNDSVSFTYQTNKWVQDV